MSYFMHFNCFQHVVYDTAIEEVSGVPMNMPICVSFSCPIMSNSSLTRDYKLRQIT